MLNYTLYHGDCLDILPTLEAGSADAVICDTPYGTTACKWDSVIPFEPMWAALKRLIKPRGAIVLFGSQPFTSALVMSNPKWFKYQWVWNKKLGANFLNANVCPLMTHEDICVFSAAGASNGSKELMTYNPIMTPRVISTTKTRGDVQYWKNPKYKHLQSRKPTAVVSNMAYPKTVLDIGGGERRGSLHPTQKPLALLEYLVKTYTNEGDLVLDFTMGSGTTGHACANTGRRFIGIEKDAQYFAIAQDRIAGAYEPLRNMEAVAC